MTTTRTYRCNLCKDQIKPGELAKKDGFGIHYIAGGDALEFKRVSECENHICLPCAKCIHDELRKVTPA